MKKIFLAAALILGFSRLALADAPEYELVCRSKAKEIAAETYRGCVVEARTTQIEQLKKDYQERLRSMKDDYERQLKQLSTGKGAVSSNDSASLPKKTRGKRLATTKLLPVKKSTTKTEVVEEMTIETKPAPKVNSDDSSLDIPEPTAIENVPTTDAASL